MAAPSQPAELPAPANLPWETDTSATENALAPYAGALMAGKLPSGAEETPALSTAAGNLFAQQKAAKAVDVPELLYTGLYSFHKTIDQWESEFQAQAANLADPSYKFMSRTPLELQHGIDAAQAEYDSITKKIATETDAATVTDETGQAYTLGGKLYEKSADLVRQSALRADIDAQRRALQRVVEPEGGPTTWQENLGAAIRRNVDPTVAGYQPPPPPSPLTAETFQGKLASNIGGMLPYTAFGLAPEGSLLRLAGGIGETGAFMAQSGAATREEAKAAGLDEAAQQRAAQMGALEGPINQIMFRMLDTMPWLKGTGSRDIGEFVQNTAKRAATFEIGSEAQRVADNIVAQASGIDPKRKMTDGLGQDLLLNAVTGVFFSGIAEGPSFAMRAIGKRNAAVYQGTPGAGPEGAPEGERPQGGEPVTPGAAIPTEEEAAKQRAEAGAQAFAAFEPAPTPTVPEPAAPPAAQSIENQIRNAYQEVSQRTGRKSVWIADVVDQSGLPTEAVKDWINAHKPDVQLDEGDASVFEQGPERERVVGASVEMGGRQRRMMAFEPSAPESVQARRAAPEGVTPPTEEAPPTPPTRADLRRVADQVEEEVGPRARLYMADERNLPRGYDEILAQNGQTRKNFKFMYDTDSGDLIVNPNNITSEAELRDAIASTALPNMFRDKATIIPVKSFYDHASDPYIAAALAQDPNADQNVWGIANKKSSQVYLNVGKMAADPANGLREIFKSAVHEIAGHIGIRRLWTDPVYMRDEFARIYNGMERSGVGEQIAASMGHTLESLARDYGFGTERPDGTWQMDNMDRAQMGDELLARYAERFSVAELDRAPNVLQKAVAMVRDGLLQHLGLKFNNAESFDLIRKAWKATDPPRDPAAEPGIQARRIAKSYVDPRLESTRTNQRATRELYDVARELSEGRRPVGPEHGEGFEVQSILDSSDRLGAYAQRTGRIYDDGTLGARVSRERGIGENAEHAIYDPIEPARNRYLIKSTQPQGFYGPYGIWAARVGTNGLNAGREPIYAPENVKTGRYDQSAATAEQYATRLGLSNELFNTGYHLEGFKHDPVNDLWSFITSQPRFDNHRLANVDEIHHYMAERGFEGIDDRTFYDPERQIAVFDAHPGNVLVHNETGKVQPVDVVPMRLGGEFADHFSKLLDDPARLQGVDLAALERQLAGMGIDVDLSKPGPEEVTAERERMAQVEAQRETEEARLVAKQRAQGGQMDPEERARLDELQFGPFYKKDVADELGPGAEGVPKQVLKVAQATMDAMSPGQALREAAKKTIKNPDDPIAVRAAAASPTQAVYEKTGQKVWEPHAEEIYRENGNDVGQVARSLMDDKYGSDISAYTYAQVVNDIRDMRAANAGMPVYQAQLDALNSKLNRWFFQKGTEWGQEGAARNNAWYGHDGVLAKYEKQVADQNEKRVGRDRNFRDAVDKTRDQLRLVGEKAISDAKPVIEKAQEAHDRAMPYRIAEALTDEVARALKLAGESANVPPDFIQRFENSVKAHIREQLPKIDRSTLQKISETDRARQTIYSWDTYREVYERAIDEMRHGMDPERLGLFLQHLDRNLDAPLGEGRLKGVLREAGVSIEDLVRQHRANVGSTALTLAQALSAGSHLTSQQSLALQRVIETHIATAVNEKTRKVFDDIIAKANNGNPVKSGRPITMKRLVDLVNMGAFDDRQVTEALAPVFGAKTFDPAVSARIRALGDQLEEIKRQGLGNTAALANIQEMQRALTRWRFDSLGPGSKLKEIFMNMYMGNLLSGIPTHVVALTSDFFNGFGNVATRLIGTGRYEAIPELLYAIGKGFARGADTAAYTMRTGYDPGSNVNSEELLSGAKRYISPINSLETDPSQRIAQKYGLKVLGMPIDWYKYIGRSITAAHSLMYEGWSAPIKYLTAYDAMRRDGNMSQGEALKAAHEAMWGDEARVQAAKEQATAEGLSGQAWRMRTQEIIDSTVEQGIRDIGDYYGRHTIYTQNPQGILGAVGRKLNELAREHPAARVVAPFTTVVSNLLNASLDYTPVGLLRGGFLRGQRGFEVAEKYLTSGGEKMSDQQVNMLRQDLLIKAFTGTTLTAAFYLLAKQMGWQINGAGPSNPKLMSQLRATGWVPNSIQIGNLFLPFESTPLAVPFGMIGAYEDANRYEKQTGFKQLLYMMSNGAASIVDRSYLKGVTQLLDAFHGRADAAGAVNAMQNEIASMKNFIPVVGSNFVSQFYRQFVDPRMWKPSEDADGPQAALQTLLRDVPFVPSVIGSDPRLNILGEPIRTSPLTQRFWSTKRDDDVWDWITHNDVAIGKPSKQTKILGEPITDAQMYDYSALRGIQIKSMIADQLDRLQGMTDPDDRKKAIQHIENRADAIAKGQVIRGEKPDLNLKGK